MKIVVDGQEIVETGSEKLLGVVINNSLTWKAHLYGDGENQGLVQQLSARVGMLKMMAKYMRRENLKFFASGIFYSKLIYCLPVYGNVLGLEEYKEDNSRYQSFTASDNKKLQVLQNNLNRVLLNARYDTSTVTLLRDTSSLSVQQMIAYHTALLAYKIVKEGKPSYLKDRLQKRSVGVNLREGRGSLVLKRKKIAITREGFICRGATLLNKLDEDLRNEENLVQFKSGLKRWVLENIPVKPASKFQVFRERVQQTLPREVTLPQRFGPQDIRSFLIDRSELNNRNQAGPAAVPPSPTDRPPPTPCQPASPNQTNLQGIQRYFRAKTSPRYNLPQFDQLARDTEGDQTDTD